MHFAGVAALLDAVDTERAQVLAQVAPAPQVPMPVGQRDIQRVHSTLGDGVGIGGVVVDADGGPNAHGFPQRRQAAWQRQLHRHPYSLAVRCAQLVERCRQRTRPVGAAQGQRRLPRYQDPERLRHRQVERPIQHRSRLDMHPRLAGVALVAEHDDAQILVRTCPGHLVAHGREQQVVHGGRTHFESLGDVAHRGATPFDHPRNDGQQALDFGRRAGSPHR